MTSTLKHYRKQPDGSLVEIGTETYDLKPDTSAVDPATGETDNDRRRRAKFIGLRNRALKSGETDGKTREWFRQSLDLDQRIRECEGLEDFA